MKGHALIHSGKWEGHVFFRKKFLFVLSNGSQRKTRTSKPYQRPRNKAERVLFVHNLAPARNDTNAVGSVPSDVRTLTSMSHHGTHAFSSVLQWTVKKRYENASASVHVMKAMRF